MLRPKASTQPTVMATSVLFQPNVLGAIAGIVRPLSAEEANDLQFVSHDKILTWEGLVENIGQPNAQVHLIDTQVYEGHYGYTKAAIAQTTTYTEANFFNDIQPPERRKYMPFLLFDFRDRPLQQNGKSYRWVLNIRRYNYADTHQQLANMLVGLKDLLSDHLTQNFGEPLLFVYNKPRSFRRPHVNHLSELIAAGFQTITEQAMIEAAGGSLVSVLNPGTAIGYLKLIKTREPITGLTPRHIAVFEDTPARIPPVTGIITLEPQTPLSHVNLLAKNRGTPNISTAKIDLIPNLSGLIGKLVKMTASANGAVSFQEVGIQEAEKFWNERSQSKIKVPAITAQSLSPVEFASSDKTERSLPNIGSKAANYATIQQLIGTQFVKSGFALSFAHYLRIAAEPNTKSLIQDLLENKGTLAPEDINSRLESIRKSIRKETSKEAIAPSINAVRTVIQKLPTDVKRIRLRSSTNSEDLPTFNGAGLYESAGFNIKDSDKKLKKKLLRVMASLWLERAFWERELFGIVHGAVGMAILINPAFSDEYANGVVIGSQENSGFRTWVNAQKGEAAVTNPLENEIPESFTFFGGQADPVEVQSRSNLGSVFLEEEKAAVRPELSSQLIQLQSITQRLFDHFVAKQREGSDRRKYGIDIEYKLMQEANQVALYVKQSRLLNLDHEAAKPNNSVSKVVAKDNGMQGGHLRRKPQQLSALTQSEFCVMKTDSVVGVNAYEEIGNGFVKLNVIIPSGSCPAFRGELYVFKQHFNFI